MDWYYANERDEQVSVSEEGLKALVDSGAITGDTLIWREGQANWQPCHTVRPEWFPQATLGGLDQPPALGQMPAAYTPPQLPPTRTAAPTDGLAITSMVLGICGVAFSFCYGFGGVLGLAAVICGHIAHKRLKFQTEIGGAGMALAGLICGYVGMLISLLFILFFAFMIGVAATSSNTITP